MTHKLKNYAIALMLGMGLAGASTAAQAGDVSMFADIGGQSQYIWRGAAQGTGQFSVQGDAGVEHASGISANVWFATGVGSSETEYDITVDYSGEAGDIGYSVGYIMYKFIEDSTLDGAEFYLGGSYGIASLTAYIADGNKYIELGAGDSIADLFDASLAIGINSPDAGSSTNHYTLGLSKDFEMHSFTLTPSLTIGKAGDGDVVAAAGVNASF